MNYEFIWNEHYKQQVIRIFHLSEPDSRKIKKYLDKFKNIKYEYTWSAYYREPIFRVCYKTNDDAMKIKKFLDKMLKEEIYGPYLEVV